MSFLRVEERESSELDDEIVDSSRLQRVGNLSKEESRRSARRLPFSFDDKLTVFATRIAIETGTT